MVEKETEQFSLAGAVLAGIAGLWLAAAPILGHMGRPWPCLVFGLAILLSVFLAWSRPRHRRGWSVFIVLFSVCSLLLGLGAVLPALLGIVGGAFLIGSI